MRGTTCSVIILEWVWSLPVHLLKEDEEYPSHIVLYILGVCVYILGTVEEEEDEEEF